MHAAISQFLRFLSVERNAAELTIKSYREDLSSLAEYLKEACGREPQPREIIVTVPADKFVKQQP